MLRFALIGGAVLALAAAFWLGRVSGDPAGEAAVRDLHATAPTGPLAAGLASPAPASTPTTPASAPAVAPSRGPAAELVASEVAPGIHRLVNPAQGLRADFSADGVAMEMAGDVPGAWTLRATAVGYGRRLTGLPAAEPRVNDEYVEFVRDQVIEWYINRSDALEQGFTVLSPPDGGDGRTRLAVCIDVESELDLEVQSDSQIVSLRDAEDRAVVAMTDFLARDADGKVLPMRIGLGATAGVVRFEVDDRFARYPVTIDPLFRRGGVSPVLERVVPNGDGTSTAHFGYLNTAGKWSEEDIQAWKDDPAILAEFEALLWQVLLLERYAAYGFSWADMILDMLRAEYGDALYSLPAYQEWAWQNHLDNMSPEERQRILEGGPVDIDLSHNYFSPAPQDRGQPFHFLPGRQVDVFQVVFAEDTIVWTLDGRTATASQDAAWRLVRPVLEYVQENWDGSYTAHWGYLNENPIPVEIPVGPLNKITPDGPDHGQVTDFAVGRVYDAFQTVFPGGRQVWTLTGPDGRTRTATAGADAARPYVGEPLHIFVNDIYENWDGSITAVFGYLNDNDHPVTIPIGPANKLSPADHNGPQTTDFVAGRMDGAWSITWPGDHNIVWTVTGPDGGTRTTTAGVDKARPYVRQPVSPVLEYIEVFPDEVVAHWGYMNHNHHPVEIPIGPDNKFVPGPDAGQPTYFAAGRNYDVFSTVITGTTVWALDGRTATAGYPIGTLYLENFAMRGGTEFRRPVESFGWLNRAGNIWDATYTAEHGTRHVDTGRPDVNSLPYAGEDVQDGGLYTSNSSTNQLLFTEEYQALDVSQLRRVAFWQSSGEGSRFYLVLKVDGEWYAAAEPWVAGPDDGSTADNTFSKVELAVTGMEVLPLAVVPPTPDNPSGIVDLDRDGTPVALPDTGRLEAFGVYFHRKDGTANRRVIDEFELIGSKILPIPAPVGIAGLLLREPACCN